MEPETDPAIWTPKRVELLNWFRSNAESLAEAYEGAVCLLSQPDFPGRVHLISHAMRDIGDRLVFALDPQEPSKRVQYENEMDEITELWPSIDRISEITDAQRIRDTVPIDYKLAQLIDGLVFAHLERRRRPPNSELLFRYLMRSEPTQAALNRRIVREFNKTCKWFMKFAHFRAENLPKPADDDLRNEFAKFEGMLHSFVGSFFTAKAEIDEILRKANQS